jgi:hypothetical protein
MYARRSHDLVVDVFRRISRAGQVELDGYLQRAYKRGRLTATGRTFQPDRLAGGSHEVS